MTGKSVPGEMGVEGKESADEIIGCRRWMRFIDRMWFIILLCRLR